VLSLYDDNQQQDQVSLTQLGLTESLTMEYEETVKPIKPG